MSTNQNTDLQSDPQGFLLGSRRLGEIEKGINHVDDNTNEILDILKATIERLGSKQVNLLQDLLNNSKLASQQQTKLVEAIAKANKQQTSRRIRSTQATVEVEPIGSANQSSEESTQRQERPSPQLRQRRSTTDVSAEPRNAPGQRERDSNGRFIGAGGVSGSTEGAKVTSMLKTAFGKAMDVIATPKDATGLDPSVDALHELSSILSPATKGFRMMGRGAAWLFKRKTKRDEVLPEEQSRHNSEVERHNHEERRLLKRIAMRLAGRDSGGGLPGLGGLGGRGGFLGNLFKKGGGILGKLLKFGKGIPLLGAGLSALSLMDWDKKSTEEKGGSVGSIAGGTAGAVVGSLLGPVGTIVGGVVGSWAGEKLGTVVAPYVKDWTDSLKTADIPTRLLNAWTTFVDGLKSYFTEKINNILELGKEAISNIEDKVKNTADGGASLIDKTLALFGNQEAKNRVEQRENGQVGYQSNVYKAQTTNNAPSPLQIAMDTAKALGTQPTSSGQSTKGSSAMSEFKGGNIAGLNSDETLAFANRVMSRENKSGKLDVVNKWGYTGKYQFGASALAETGFINKDKLMKAGKGVKNGSDAKAHRAFLADKSNWVKGDWDTYKNSAEMQDESFRKLTEANLSYGKNVHKGNTKKMMGFAMAAHLKGAGNAKKWYQDGIDSKDGNGTRLSDYAKFGEGTVVKPANAIQPATKATTQIPVTIKAPPAKATTALPPTIKAPPVPPKLTTTDLVKMIAVNKPVLNVGTPAPLKIQVPNPKAPKVENIKQPVSSPQMQSSSRSPMDAVIPQNISDRGLAHTATGGLGMSQLG